MLTALLLFDAALLAFDGLLLMVFIRLLWWR